MSPLRWDVLAVSFVLALPLFGLWLRGEFTLDELTSRLLWCLAAGWAAVALVRWAATPKEPAGGRPAPAPAEDEAPTPA